MLFASDDELIDAQRKSSILPRGETITPMEKRFEQMEFDRERREHKRLRQFAFLLFVAPSLWAAISAIVGYVISRWMLNR